MVIDYWLHLRYPYSQNFMLGVIPSTIGSLVNLVFLAMLSNKLTGNEISSKEYSKHCQR